MAPHDDPSSCTLNPLVTLYILVLVNYRHLSIQKLMQILANCVSMGVRKMNITDCVFCFVFTGVGNLERLASPMENLKVKKLKIH